MNLKDASSSAYSLALCRFASVVMTTNSNSDPVIEMNVNGSLKKMANKRCTLHLHDKTSQRNYECLSVASRRTGETVVRIVPVQNIQQSKNISILFQTIVPEKERMVMIF